MPDKIHHALVLNFHQPSENLEGLLAENEWEAKEILWTLDRVPRTLWNYEEIARVHLSLSGTLLETLSSPGFQSRVYGVVKCGKMLWHYQNTRIIEILGTGYYHPVLPLVPSQDREEHCIRWQGIARHLFWRLEFPGFWPPEMGFCMEMIPMLRRLGYRYVFVDSENVEPLDEMSWQETRYRPHFARYGDDEIIVIVRDRELSDAQLSGMDLGWFEKEVKERTKWCDFPPLVTTCTDGDNGGWFRNTNKQSNFWNYFYMDLLENVKNGTSPISPVFINDYLNQFGASKRVNVKTAAWNTGWHNGKDFVQWTGSQAQKDALKRVAEVSGRYHDLKASLSPEAANEIYWHILRAQTSCNFFWGEAWVYKCHQDLDEAEGLMKDMEKMQPLKAMPERQLHLQSDTEV